MPDREREIEREIKFIGLFGDRGHWGPYSPYKPCNHNLYIGVIIFPHIDNPQSTGCNYPKKKIIKIINEQGKSEGFDSCNRPSILTWSWIQSVNFWAHVTWKFDGRPPKTIGHLLYNMSSFVHHSKPSLNSNWSYSPEKLNLGQNWRFFPLWPQNLTDDFEKP